MKVLSREQRLGTWFAGVAFIIACFAIPYGYLRAQQCASVVHVDGLLVCTTPSTAGPTPTPTATPTPSSTSSAVDWPAGQQNPFFGTNPFSQTVTSVISSPGYTPNPSSSTWANNEGTLGNLSFGTFNVTVNPSYGYGFALFYNHSGANTTVTISCSTEYVSGVPCNSNGLTLGLDSREYPQSGGESTSNPCNGCDAHMAIIDQGGTGYEWDHWQTYWPNVLSNPSTLNVTYAGRCDLGGNGYTNAAYLAANPSRGWNAGCVADATGTPQSLGVVRAQDLLLELSDTVHGHLPMAMSYAAGCVGSPPLSLPTPFLGSGDSHSTTCGQTSAWPPEGAHLYLNVHDSTVNTMCAANSLPQITCLMIRSLDEDNYGAIAVDTNGCACNQIQFNMLGDQTYSAWGLTTPYLTNFQPVACTEGLPGACSTVTLHGYATYSIGLGTIPAVVQSWLAYE